METRDNNFNCRMDNTTSVKNFEYKNLVNKNTILAENKQSSEGRYNKKTDRIKHFYGKSSLGPSKKDREKYYESLRKSKKTDRFRTKRKLESHKPEVKCKTGGGSVTNLLAYINSQKFTADFDYKSHETFQKSLWELLKNIEGLVGIEKDDILSLISLVENQGPVKQLIGLSLIKKYTLKGAEGAQELVHADVICTVAPMLDKKELQKYVREAIIIFINLSSYNDDVIDEMVKEEIHVKMGEILAGKQYSAFNRLYCLWGMSNMILTNEVILIEFQKKEGCKELMGLYNEVKQYPKKVAEIVQFILNFITVSSENNYEYETLLMFPILLNIIEDFYTTQEYEEVVTEAIGAISKFSDAIVFGGAALEQSEKLQKIFINLITSSNINVIINVLKIISNHLYGDKEIHIKYVEDKLCNHLMAIVKLNNDEIIQKVLFILYTVLDTNDEFVLDYVESSGMTKLPFKFISSSNKDIIQEGIWGIYCSVETIEVTDVLIDSLIEAIPKVDSNSQLQILKIFDQIITKGNKSFTNCYIKYFDKGTLLDQLERLQYSKYQDIYELACQLLDDIFGEDETSDIKTLVENYGTDDIGHISF